MTNDLSDTLAALSAKRRSLSRVEQMADAQSQCVPCSLCGGKAVITDAGIGAGYYVACENGLIFDASKRCLLDERRLSGWAYNVMEWWNRMHTRSGQLVLVPSVSFVARSLYDAIGYWGGLPEPECDVMACYRHWHELHEIAGVVVADMSGSGPAAVIAALKGETK